MKSLKTRRERSRARRSSFGALSLGVCVALSACAHGAKGASSKTAADSSKESQVAVLERKLAERDRQLTQIENRLALIEAEQRQMRYALSENVPAEPVGIRETVRIGKGRSRPEEAEPTPQAREEREPEEELVAPPPRAERRPILRLVGEKKRERSDDYAMMPVPEVSERLPIAPLPEVSAVSAPLDPQTQYERAIDLVRQRNFTEALTALTEFLAKFPSDARAPRAMFWRGEVLFAQREYGRALDAFETALLRDPAGDRAPDALLKVSLCHKRLGAPERARVAIERLKAQFPQSEAAKLAAQEDA